MMYLYTSSASSGVRVYCVFVYVYMCVLYVHLCAYACLSIHVCVLINSICMYVCMHVCMYVRMYVRMYVYALELFMNIT